MTVQVVQVPFRAWLRDKSNSLHVPVLALTCTILAVYIGKKSIVLEGPYASKWCNRVKAERAFSGSDDLRRLLDEETNGLAERLSRR